MPEKIPPNRPDYSLLSKVWSIGSAIIFLTLLGYWLDRKFHSSCWTLVGAGLGVLYCFYQAWQALKDE